MSCYTPSWTDPKDVVRPALARFSPSLLDSSLIMRQLGLKCSPETALLGTVIVLDLYCTAWATLPTMMGYNAPKLQIRPAVFPASRRRISSLVIAAGVCIVYRVNDPCSLTPSHYAPKRKWTTLPHAVGFISSHHQTVIDILSFTLRVNWIKRSRG